MSKFKIFFIVFFLLISASSLFCSTGDDEEMPWHSPFERFYNYLIGGGGMLFGSILIGCAIALVAATKGQGVGKLAWVIAAVAGLLNVPTLINLIAPNASGFIF